MNKKGDEVMNKKALALIITIAFSISTAGCAKNQNDAEDNNKGEQTISQKVEVNNELTLNKAIPDEEYIKYLKNNVTNLDIEDNDDFSSFKLLNENLENKEVFLIGEEHDVKDNYKIYFKALKYFKEKTNFKYLLCEIPYLNGKRLNEYLKTGDEKLINNISILEKKEFWNKLYKYNSSLKNEDKIIVVGTDTSDMSVALPYLTETLSNKELPKELEEDFTLLKDYKNHMDKIFAMDDVQGENEYFNSYKENKSRFFKVYDSIKNKKDSYEKVLKESMFEFEYVLDNIKNLIDIQDKYQEYVQTNNFAVIQRVRDLKMYENFKKLYENYPKGKYFGQFGLTHVYQKEILGINNLATKMDEENSPLHNKVLSIACFYDDCYSSRRGQEPFSSYKINNIFDKYLKTNATLIKIDGKNSPFSKELKWDFIYEPYGKAEEGVTTDYFQYMIIIKNSEAATPTK